MSKPTLPSFSPGCARKSAMHFRSAVALTAGHWADCEVERG